MTTRPRSERAIFRGCWRFAFLAAFLGGVVGCRRPPEAPADSGNAKAEAPAVKVARPKRQTVRHPVQQPGYNIEAFEQAPLYAKVAGYVRKLHVDIGDPVKEGQVLVEVWVPEMEVEVKERKAAVRQAEAEVAQGESALAAATANVSSAAALVKEAEAGRARARAAHVRAKTQYERLTRAGRTGVIDRDSLAELQLGVDVAAAAQEEVEAKVKSTQAQHEESRAKRDKAEADVRVLKARLEVAKEKQEYAETLLGYTKVRAPFNGVVTRRPDAVNVGHFVQPPVGGSKGDPLLVVERTDVVRVFVNVPELDAVWVRAPKPGQPGLPARVRVQGLRGREFRGAVTRTAWALDPRTRTLRTEIDLPNRDGLLSSGMYASVTILVEHPNVWTLPSSAVLTGDGESFCYRLERGKAVRTPLLVGLTGGGRVEVLKKRTAAGEDSWEDMTGDEEVLVGDVAGLKDGQAVRRESGG